MPDEAATLAEILRSPEAGKVDAFRAVATIREFRNTAVPRFSSRTRCVRDVSGRTLIEKAIIRPASRERAWLNEALFYTRLRSRISHLRVPQLYAIAAPGDGELTLSLEHLDGYRRLSTFDDRLAASAAFGRFAAQSHVESLHDTAWLPRSPGIGNIDYAGKIEPVLRQTFNLPTKTLASFSAFVQNTEALRALYRAATPTLCHGDAGWTNVLVHDDAPAAAVDWACICSGRIGDDLCRLAYPWIVTGSGAGTAPEMMDLDCRLLEAYSAAAREICPAASGEAITTAYAIRSIILGFGITPQLAAWVARSREAQLSVVAEYYALLARRADHLLSQSQR